MNRFALLFSVVMFIISAGMLSSASAQNEPVMYFCEQYSDNGEIGVADRFTTGYLTVMIKCDRALNLEDVSIQFDKWDSYTGKFNYYKKFDYSIEPDMNYIFFSKNDDSDMSFDDPGFYRVFLLDDRGNTVASALVQIIE